MENATSFGAQADVYAQARPHYPEALFDWIAQQAQSQEAVWDVGTGSGQAAASLVNRFSRVYATDIDAAQIAQAVKLSNAEFRQAPAERSGLSDGSVDAVTVATALHWFDFERFWVEVARVARPGALFCAWTYYRAETDADIASHLVDPVMDILEPYWSEGNQITWRGYLNADVKCPFERIKAPEFSCELNWTPAQIINFMRSMSAHKRARLDGHENALDAIEAQALKKLGDTTRPYALPLHILAARIV